MDLQNNKKISDEIFDAMNDSILHRPILERTNTVFSIDDIRQQDAEFERRNIDSNLSIFDNNDIKFELIEDDKNSISILLDP